MKRILQRVLVATACVAACAVAPAQTPPAASGPSASAPGGRMGGGGPMRGWHMNKSNTPGWSMMNRSERAEHRNKMMGMKNYEECRAYIDQHHATMMERAKAKGLTPPAQPAHDPCLRLKG
ncbi:MAG: hypothetical protein ACKOF9_16275 [Burkholderiales bacterium]